MIFFRINTVIIAPPTVRTRRFRVVPSGRPCKMVAGHQAWHSGVSECSQHTHTPALARQFSTHSAGSYEGVGFVLTNLCCGYDLDRRCLAMWTSFWKGPEEAHFFNVVLLVIRTVSPTVGLQHRSCFGLLTGGNGMGCMRHLRGKSVRTHHTCLPSDHLLCCVKIKVHCIMVASFARHREKHTPQLGPPPPFKSARWLQ